MKFRIGQKVALKTKKTDGSQIVGKIYGVEKANGFYLGRPNTDNYYKVVYDAHNGEWVNEKELTKVGLNNDNI